MMSWNVKIRVYTIDDTGGVVFGAGRITEGKENCALLGN